MLKDEDLEIVTGCLAKHPNQRGGQHVAMSCVCVLVIHKPTGLAVRVDDERSQLKNKRKAIEMLTKVVGLVKSNNWTPGGNEDYFICDCGRAGCYMCTED